MLHQTAALILAIFASAPLAALGDQPVQVSPPLASWNDTDNKRAIIQFVQRISDVSSPVFVPPADRIAVFDNDGTLWPENPMPFQLAFALDELKRRLPKETGWKNDPFVKEAIEGNVSALLADNYMGLFHILDLVSSGITTEYFAGRVRDWLTTAKHPRFNRPYDQLAYQPMLEMLAYLRAHDFKTFIVSGGGADFMRVFSERVYGIPPEQVVGSNTRVIYELRDDGPVLVKTMDDLFIDDGKGKPAGIHQFIGRRPIACVGNSDGDQAMLEFTTINNPRPSLGMIIHHTDASREYAYDKTPESTGKLVSALQAATQRGWLVVDIKNDWARIFAP